MKTISSQRHIDPAIVAEKIEAADYLVMVSPEFSYDGQQFRVIIDGHHSREAAIEAGAEPVYITATKQDNDRIFLLESGQVEDYLEASWVDSNWYDVETGRDIW